MRLLSWPDPTVLMTALTAGQWQTGRSGASVRSDSDPSSPPWRCACEMPGADALAWHDAPPSILQLTDVSVAAVAHGLLFRRATTSEFVASGAAGVNLKDEARRYSLAAAAIGV